jgi:NodT family efflux transporter outer membrane factor (OMF) lipoprotein
MRPMRHIRNAWKMPALAGFALLAGCRVGPHYQRPAALPQPPPPAYKESTTQVASTDGWKVAQPQDAMLRGKWWQIYDDPELNTLEDRLNIDNQNIKLYFENLMEARTLVAQARSQYYPTVSIGPSFLRTKSSGNIGNAAVASGGITTGPGGTGTGVSSGTVTNVGQQNTLMSMPLDVSWEPDFWGRVRNLVREYQYSAQMSAADLENERLTEQATLAADFFQIRGQDALLDVLNRTVNADQAALQLVQSQYETGVGDQISVVEAQNTLQNAQSALTNAGVARAQYEHAIAVLIGTNPSSFSIPPKPLTSSPPAIPVGMPSQLLERRPDVAASERAMASANAAIGVADAAFYPTLALSAQGGFDSSSWSRLFNWSSRIWSVGPTISETVFDAGLRRATVNQYISIYNADVASYRQTVLTAFQQVEDALAQLRILSQQLIQVQAAVHSAQTFVDLETARFQTGIDPYVDVVTAQTTLLTDQQTLATLRTQEMTASVQLIVALGGGWDSSQLPTPKAVSQNLSGQEKQIQH